MLGAMVARLIIAFLIALSTGVPLAHAQTEGERARVRFVDARGEARVGRAVDVHLAALDPAPSR